MQRRYFIAINNMTDSDSRKVFEHKKLYLANTKVLNNLFNCKIHHKNLNYFPSLLIKISLLKRKITESYVNMTSDYFIIFLEGSLFHTSCTLFIYLKEK